MRFSNPFFEGKGFKLEKREDKLLNLIKSQENYEGIFLSISMPVLPSAISRKANTVGLSF